jgi:3-hydroxyisobutyrate dehydrogenase
MPAINTSASSRTPIHSTSTARSVDTWPSALACISAWELSGRTLLVMVGGKEEHLARCRPVFDTFADPVIHLGPLGSGQMAKLVNNLVFTAQVTLSLETFVFAEELGMDRSAMAEVLAQGSGGSRASAILAGSGFDTSGMRQAVANLQKDIRIVIDVAQRRQASEPAGIVNLAKNTLVTLAGGDSTPNA